MYPINPRRLWISKRDNLETKMSRLQKLCHDVVAFRYNCTVSVEGTGSYHQLVVILTFGDLKDFRWSILDELSKTLEARTIINPVMYGGDANWENRHNGVVG
jgi:hypothetical protein